MKKKYLSYMGRKQSTQPAKILKREHLYASLVSLVNLKDL
jgi:hypothetical protein